MDETGQKLVDTRARRKAVRGRFDARLAQIRQDLEARSIGGRIKDKAAEETGKALADGLTIARESKGIIAGTVAALLAWMFRKPLVSMLLRLFSGGQKPTDRTKE